MATTTAPKSTAAPLSEAVTTAPKSTAAPLSEAVTKAGDQLVSAVKQGQKITLDVATSIAKATPSAGAVDKLKVPGVPAVEDVQAVWIAGFDVAIELLTIQRDFAVNLAAAWKQAKAA